VKTLVICRPAAGVSGEQIAPHASDELAALRDLQARGLLLEAYSPGGPGAILIFATDGDEVHEALEALPLRRAGLIETERIPLRPFDLG
jgi:hypothetical protein